MTETSEVVVPATPPVTSVAARDITIDRIALRACRFDDHLFEQTVLQIDGAPDPTPKSDRVRLSSKIGVWISPESRFALVRLIIEATPHSQPTWTAMVEVVGKYSCGEDPVIPLERFAWMNGIAYLVPYVRERLASMTAASVFETYMLPPLSVARLIELSKENPEPSPSEE